jgi:hypothetical protein
MSQLPLVVFDVNETLLDLETMNPVFERAMPEWIIQMATSDLSFRVWHCAS